MTICLPAVTVPLVISAALTGGGLALVGGTAVAAAVGVIGYCGMFVALGLRFKRALVWGLAYILLWEGYVAKASKTASRLSLRAYTRSIVSQYTGVRLDQAGLTIVGRRGGAHGRRGSCSSCSPAAASRRHMWIRDAAERQRSER